MKYPTNHAKPRQQSEFLMYYNTLEIVRPIIATYCNMSPENAIAHRVCKYGAQSSHRGKGTASAKAPRGKTCDPPAPRGVALTKPNGTRTGAQNQFISNYRPYHPDRITSPSKHRSGIHYYISGTLSLVPGTLYLNRNQPACTSHLHRRNPHDFKASAKRSMPFMFAS